MPTGFFNKSHSRITNYALAKGSFRQRHIGQVLIYMVLIFFSILFLLPFYIIVRNALMTQDEITSPDWTWLPASPHFENLITVFDPITSMAVGMENSFKIAVIEVIGQMLFASMAGYGLARIPYRWRNLVFYTFLVTIMIPGAVTFIPTFVVVVNLGMYNTLQGIILPNLFNVFATFLFRQFYLNFPRELEDAGRVDGLSYWGIYWRLLLPNSQAILLSLGALTFIDSWNSYLWPLVIGLDPSVWPVQIVLTEFQVPQTVTYYPALFMGTVVSMLPLLIMFVVLQRYIVQGVVRTGVNG
jgi:multiple sugar transport system permease protein